MDEADWLAARFEEQRAHLRAVAYRMLGSLTEADDAVQNSWLRLSRADAAGVENLGGWLTTVVARECLKMVRARRSRREDPLTDTAAELPAGDQRVSDPAAEVLLADSVGPALMVVLDTLAPAERLAFVLHDAVELRPVVPMPKQTGLITASTHCTCLSGAKRASARGVLARSGSHGAGASLGRICPHQFDQTAHRTVWRARRLTFRGVVSSYW
jgi:DNA-directed RNA polymerase specialized sigma24 family protein